MRMQHEGARLNIAVRRHNGANGRPRRRHHLSMLRNVIWNAATMLRPLTGWPAAAQQTSAWQSGPNLNDWSRIICCPC